MVQPSGLPRVNAPAVQWYPGHIAKAEKALGEALAAEPRTPELLGLRRHHVAAVEHQQVLLARDPALQARMASGQGDARIAHLDHQIHLGQGLAEGPLRLGDVARIPLNGRRVNAQPRGRCSHQGTTSTGHGASWITRAAVLC